MQSLTELLTAHATTKLAVRTVLMSINVVAQHWHHDPNHIRQTRDRVGHLFYVARADDASALPLSRTVDTSPGAAAVAVALQVCEKRDTARRQQAQRRVARFTLSQPALLAV